MRHSAATPPIWSLTIDKTIHDMSQYWPGNCCVLTCIYTICLPIYKVRPSAPAMLGVCSICNSKVVKRDDIPVGTLRKLDCILWQIPQTKTMNLTLTIQKKFIFHIVQVVFGSINVAYSTKWETTENQKSLLYKV